MKRLILFLVFIQPYFLNAQDEVLKVLSYNLLNYPNPEYDTDTRADTLKKIIDYYTPDLFLMQELKKEVGLTTILQNTFNSNGIDYYQSGTWESQNSDPGSSWKLQQNLIYNTQKLALEYQTFLYTNTRDINVFKFYFKDPNLPMHGQKTFLYTVVLHLKSSTGGDNVAERLSMTEILVNFLDTLPENSAVIIGGDYNIYSSSEPAYQHLLNPSNLTVIKDPINTPGSWNNNYTYRAVHTQSTRTGSLNGDGAPGGLDDRFDFILVSENLLEENQPIQVVENTYEAIGNNGNCYNGRIIDCDNNTVPDDILYALYQMSDHLPIKMELAINYPIYDAVSSESSENPFSIYKSAPHQIRIEGPPSNYTYELYSIEGKLILSGNGFNQTSFKVEGIKPGMYLIRLFSDNVFSKTLFID